MKHRISVLTIITTIVMLSISLSSSAYAYSGSNYTSNTTLAQKIDNLIQGNIAIFSNTTTKFKVGSSLNNNTEYKWANNGYSGYQCYAYAQAAYYYLFGDVPFHGGGGYSNSRLVSGMRGLKSLSYDTLANAGVGCGAYIRTTGVSDGAYSGSSGHSMIVLTYNSSNITVLHGNSNGSGLISITSYSWSDFNSSQISGRSRTVSHIVQPNLTSYSINLPEVPSIQNATCPEALSNGASFDLRGTISCKYNMTEIRGIIYNCTTGEKIFDISVTPNSNSYTIGSSGEAISNGLQFSDSRLYDSWCRFELKVTYNNNGKTCIKRIHDRYFKVGSPADMTFLQPGVYRFCCDDESRSAPGEGNSIVNSYSEGSIVFAEGYDYKTNVWLQLTDGSYVFSGDVDRVTWTEDNFSGTLFFLNSGVAETYPYKSGPDYQQYDAGSQVTAIAQLTNTEGELWYKIADGSYVYSGDVEYSISGSCGDNATWSYSNGVLTISGSGRMADAQYINNMYDRPWVSFAESIHTVVINEGITYIGEASFEGLTALTSVSIPDTVTYIAYRAFCNCKSLQSIDLPNSLTYIGSECFYRCSDLKSITMPDSVTNMGWYVFNECPALASIKLSNNLGDIKYGSFIGCSSLNNVVIPEGVTKIGYRAFEGCVGLQSITIPASVTGIDVSTAPGPEDAYQNLNSPFLGCSDVTIYCWYDSAAHAYAYENDIQFIIIGGKCGDNVTWHVDGTTLTISGSGEMYDYDQGATPWDQYRSSLKSLVVNDGVTNIGNYAFADFDLTSISLPGSVKTIHFRAFLYNGNLQSISLPEGLEWIRFDGFAGCSSLKTIVFPESLKRIDGMAFQGAAFETVTIPAGLTTITNNPFCNCGNLKSFIVAGGDYFKAIDGVLYTKDGKTMIAYPFASERTSYSIISGTEQIVNNAFYGNRNLTEVTIPEGVRSLGENVFYNDNTIRTIYVPMSLTDIGSDALYGYTSENVTLMCWDGTYVHSYAIDNDISYALLDTPLNRPDFTLPGSTKVIEAEAFSGINAKRVKLPEGVTQIASKAFADCPNLVAIYIPEGCTSIASNAFANVSGLTIYGVSGSYAGYYAQSRGFTFVEVPE